MMRAAFTLLLLFSTLITLAQSSLFSGEAYIPRSSEALSEQFGEYHVFRIDVSALNQYVKNEQGVRPLRFELGDLYAWDLEIVANDLRTPDYQIRVATEKGIVNHPVSENKTFKGTHGQVSSDLVALTLDHEFIYGYIEEGEESYFMEPLYYFLPAAERDLFVVYPASKVIPVEGKKCGVTEMHAHTPGVDDWKGMEGVETGNCYRVELAIASDWLMFQKYGSISAVENHNIAVINNVNTNFDNEFSDELNFYIVEQFVSDCSTCDPWTSSTNPGTLLNSFTNWGPSGFNATHDLGELWTDRDLNNNVIGIAWLDGICTSDRYHLLQDFSTNANLLRVLAAHEIGHNLDATHDSPTSPTIMRPSVNNTNAWSNQSVNEINSTILQIDPPNGCLAVCPPPAPPTPGFSANITTLCPGSFVTFFDESLNQPSSWSWSMPGANPSSSTERSPTVVYNNPGGYNVMLSVTNANGTNTLTKPAYIIVTPTGGTDFFFFEGFESGTGGWNISNPDNGITWANTNVNGTRQGSKAMMVNNYGYTSNGQRDGLISPTFSLFGRNNATLEVEYAYARYNSTRRDSLIVYISTNNGASYTRLFAATENGNGNFATKDDMTTPFNPQNTGEWCFGTGGPNCLSLNLAAYANEPNCRIKIQNYTGHGNRMYVDNIRVLSDCEVAIPPVADFIGIPTSGCAPLQVNFQDQSTDVPLAWSWSFPGAIPTSSSLQNPIVLFPSPGEYTVTLTAINPAGVHTITKTNYIVVEGEPTAEYTYVVNGSTASFTNISSANSTTYEWDFGDGTNSTEENPPPHTYTEDGAYVVILTVTNECGTSIFPQTLFILTPPSAGFSATPTAGCAPMGVQFTDESSSNTTGWEWSFPGGDPSSSSEEDPLVTYNNPGTYEVTLVVGNSQGTDTIVQPGFITVDTATVTGFTFTVAGDTATFTNTSAHANSYLWDFGDGNTSTETHPIHVYLQSGAYEVSLTAYGNCDTVTLIQTVETTQVPAVEFSADVTNGCIPFTVHFMDESAHFPTSWAWTFEGGTPATSTDQDPVVEYLSAGTFDVSLIVTNSQGSDTIVRPDYIVAEEGPTAGFTSAENGTSVDFINSSTNADTYQWDFGDGDTSTETDPTHDFGTDGTYTVQLIATNNCGPDTTTEVIVIVTPPLAGFSADQTEGCAPLLVQFTDESSPNTTAWNWTFEGGTPATSTDQNPLVEYLTPGVYGVTLTVSNAAGESTESVVDLIEVFADPSAAFTSSVNGFTANFTNGSTEATSYQWAFGDGNTSTESDPEHTYSNDGVFLVQLIATNNCGSDTTEVEVGIMTPPIAGFSADQTEGCAPLLVQFTDESSANTSTWSWTFDGGTPATSSDQNPLVEYLTPGVYGVTLTVTNPVGESTESFSDYIEVFAGPTAAFTSSVNGDTVDFTNSSIESTSYHWDFGDTNTSTESDPQHVYGTDGVYTVELIATNSCGSDTLISTVEVTLPPTAGFSADQTQGCAPLMVQFSDLSSANATSWNWTFEGGDPSTSTDPNPLVEYLSPGVYGVTLTVGNTAGEDTETFEDYITVLGSPTAGFEVAVNGTNATFTNNSIEAETYEWDFGDGIGSLESDPTHDFEEDGVYTVTLIATNECDSDTLTTEVVIVTPPTAGFTADQTEGCLPMTVQYMDLSSPNTTAWSWTFEGGVPESSTEQNPIVEYLQAGTFGVTLTASNAAGESIETFEDYITVLPNPVAGFTFTVNGDVINLTNTSSNGDSYIWDFGDSSGSTIPEPGPHTYSEDGVYEITLTVMNDCGMSTFTETLVIATSAPLALFTAEPTSGCAPLEVVFENLSSANAETFAWEFPGGDPSSSSEFEPVVTYTTPGIYDVTLTATNVNGSDTYSQTTYIEVLPTTESDFTYTIVNGATVEFTNTSSNATSYSWSFGNGEISSEENPEHVYQQIGTYTVQLVADGICGLDTITQEIEILAVIPSASFTGEPVSGCAPLVVEFKDDSQGNPSAWNWSFPGGNPASSTDQNPIVEYGAAGQYTVTLNVSNIAGSDVLMQSDMIEVSDVPTVGFSYEIQLGGNTVIFTNSSSGATSYSWTFGDGETSELASPTHIYSEPGNYTVILTATNECGSETQEITIVLSSLKDLGLFEELLIYPNPNEGQFTVRIVAPQAGNEPVQLRLVNALGQILMEQTHLLYSGELTVLIGQKDLASGFYWLEVQLGDQMTGKKVVVE